jgi:hypothetical protein
VNVEKNIVATVVMVMGQYVQSVVLQHTQIMIWYIRSKTMGNIYEHNGSSIGSCVGRIENDGSVFTGLFGGSYKGKVDRGGYVYEPGLLSNGSIIGRVTNDGKIYSGSFGGSYLGHVDSSGFIFEHSGIFSGSIVGKADSPNQLEGGAAFLLLLKS